MGREGPVKLQLSSGGCAPCGTPRGLDIVKCSGSQRFEEVAARDAAVVTSKYFQ